MESPLIRSRIWWVIICAAVSATLFQQLNTQGYIALGKSYENISQFVWAAEAFLYVIVPLLVMRLWQSQGTKQTVLFLLIALLGLAVALAASAYANLWLPVIGFAALAIALLWGLRTVFIVYVLKTATFKQRVYYLLTLSLLYAAPRVFTNFLYSLLSSSNHLILGILGAMLLGAFFLWQTADLQEDISYFEGKVEIDEWTRKIEEIGREEGEEVPLTTDSSPLRTHWFEYPQVKWGLAAIFCFYFTEHFLWRAITVGVGENISGSDNFYAYSGSMTVISLISYLVLRYILADKPHKNAKVGAIYSLICIASILLFLFFSQTSTFISFFVIIFCNVGFTSLILELSTRNLGSQLPQAVAWQQTLAGSAIFSDALLNITVLENNKHGDSQSWLLYPFILALLVSYLVLFYYFYQQHRTQSQADAV